MGKFTLTNKNYQEGLNYWELNPQVKMLKPFKPLYNLDEGGEQSSNYMWATFFLEDNDEDINKLAPLSEELKIETIKESFFPSLDYNLPEFLAAREGYTEYCMSKAQRTLKAQEHEINRLQTFCRTTTPTWDEPDPNSKTRTIKGTASQIASTTKVINALIKELKDLNELFEVEKKENIVFGGRNETLAEKGLIAFLPLLLFLL